MSPKTPSPVATQEAKAALVPKLRFPEFRGAAGWENASLGDLSEVVRGGSPRPIDGYLTTAADGLNWLKIGDVDKEAKYVTYTAEKVRPEALSKTRVVNPGDLILSNSMSFGRPYILQIKTCIHDGWIAITEIARKAERDFLYYSISAPNSQSYFVDNAAGSGVQNLNADIIKALPVCFPLPAEQQKIADCLCSLDELIAAQARKVEALKTHKKGLMQQLFPREGEIQPRHRFPEFQSADEWEPKLLGDVVKSFKTGKLDANSMVEYGQYRFYTCAKNYYQIDHYAFEGEALLVAGNGAHLGYIHHYIGKFNAYQRTYVLQDFKANVVFLRCLLDRYLPARIQFEKKDGNTPYIVLSTLTEMPLVIPRDPAEQQRIADCLSSLDAHITAAAQELDTLKTHKQGLMQQLFPSPEAAEA